MENMGNNTGFTDYTNNINYIIIIPDRRMNFNLKFWKLKKKLLSTVL